MVRVTQLSKDLEPLLALAPSDRIARAHGGIDGFKGQLVIEEPCAAVEVSSVLVGRKVRTARWVFRHEAVHERGVLPQLDERIAAEGAADAAGSVIAAVVFEARALEARKREVQHIDWVFQGRLVVSRNIACTGEHVHWIFLTLIQ